MHQTNGRFVYVRLNADCSPKVSERQQRNNTSSDGAACVFCCINLEDNYNKFDGNMQTNVRLSSISQFQTITRGRAVQLASINFDNKNKSE